MSSDAASVDAIPVTAFFPVRQSPHAAATSFGHETSQMKHIHANTRRGGIRSCPMTTFADLGVPVLGTAPRLV